MRDSGGDDLKAVRRPFDRRGTLVLVVRVFVVLAAAACDIAG